MKRNKKPKIWRWILLGIIIIVVWVNLKTTITMNDTITLKQGDTLQTLIQDLSWKQKMSVKWYIRKHDIDLSKLDIGSYIFSGEYTSQTFVETIVAGPKYQYQTIKILEWWSIYDIDSALSAKWYISAGEYISFVTNQSIIQKYQQRYAFLTNISWLKSLEGFLYPDTYSVDKDKNILDQLVYLQLQAFKTKVWDAVEDQALSFDLSWYDTIKMASIVEKEEKSSKNKPTVAGILIKRFQLGTLIGADISLCYFFEKPYKECTPSFIGQHVSDTNNPYNTRTLKWLPPQPISNPAIGTIKAVLDYEKTDYLFYLHDSNGGIHYGRTLQEHNQNKNMYL